MTTHTDSLEGTSFDPAKMKGLATDRQIDYITELFSKHEGYSEAFRGRVTAAIKSGTLPKGKASEIISFLRKHPKASGASSSSSFASSSVKIDEGFWITDASNDVGIDVWRVKKNREGNMYARRLRVITKADGKKRGKWDFVRGAMKIVRDAKLNPRPMTVDEAKKYGKAFGICARCGATLSVEDSVERMLGPVCFDKIQASNGL